MTNSSCAFCLFSPVIALERGKRNPSTGGVAANVIDVSVKSIFVVFFVSCATSLARMKGRSVSPLFVKTHRVPIEVRHLALSRFRAHRGCTRSSLSCTRSQAALLLHTVWKEAMHLSHRRSTRDRNWPSLQNTVLPLLVQIQTPANSQFESMLASTHVALPRTQFSAMWFPRIHSSQFVRKVLHQSTRDTITDFIAQSFAFRGKCPEC